MLPKSYLVFKWFVYALAGLFLCALQSMFFVHIRVMNLTPFVYPVLPALVAMYEGSRRGGIHALVFGVVCGLLLPAPFPGFFAIAFSLAALLSAYISGNLLSPGSLCAFVVSTLALLLTGGLRILAAILSGGGYLTLMAQIALGETLLTLPLLLIALPLYRAVYQRCAADY